MTPTSPSPSFAGAINPRAMIIVHSYKDVERFLGRLPPIQRSGVYRHIDLLRHEGYAIRMPFSKPLGKGLFELRVNVGLQIRIIFAYRRQAAILLHAFTKKTQATPREAIELAQRRLREFDS